MQQNRHILVVDDEAESLRAVALILKSSGCGPVLTTQRGRDVADIVAKHAISVVLLDLTMPDMTGEAILSMLRSERPELSVIIISGANDVNVAVGCLKRGAHDFLLKPIDRDRLLVAVRHALELDELRHENQRLGERVMQVAASIPAAYAPILTADPGMLALFSYCEAIAPSSQPVLITGETGTGKELIARAIHERSGRRGDLVAVNVAGLDDTMLADALFGHRRGAFTGADSDRAGLVERAAGGTLFLDEVGDLCQSSQVKLLRLVQEGEYMPLGVDEVRRSSARIIAATSRPLCTDEVGGFRKDLYYRLRAHQVRLPALRERLGDLRLLVPHFVAEVCRELRRSEPDIADDVFPWLAAYPFPGNIRELRALIVDAVASGGGTLHARYFAKLGHLVPHAASPALATFGPVLPTLKDLQQLLFEEALRRAGGSQVAAARLIGITRQAVFKRLHAKQR